jgi:hypothetical protein
MKFLLSSFFIFCLGLVYAQGIVLSKSLVTRDFLNLERKERTIKSGTYYGLQSGRFYVFEYGWELQKKTRQDLIHSNTTAVHHGFNASFDFSRLNPILGYDLGFWSRTGNIDFTYGLNAAVRTDLKQLRFGVCPTIGIKVWQLHVQTGLYLLAPFYAINENTFNSNTFFISARFLLVKNKR